MRSDCDICGGAGKIRLPVRSAPSASAYRQHSIAIKSPLESSREYACPECSEIADDNRVMIMGAQEEYAAELADHPEIADQIRRGMARPLADMLIEKGFVRFCDGPQSDYRMRKSLRAYVGVVAVGAAKRIEDRIAERQWEMAEKVLQDAADAVRHWGSSYSGRSGPINKDDAVRQMFEVLKMAKAKPGNEPA